jgi:hypothetical protein
MYSYDQFVFYTLVCATIALDRKTIREKVINAPEILQVRGAAGKPATVFGFVFQLTFVEHVVGL